MGYFPFRTTITQGDIARRPDTGVNNALGSLINASRPTFARQTGYTMQQYNSANVNSIQTNRYKTGFKPVNRPTVPASRLSNKALPTKQMR